MDQAEAQFNFVLQQVPSTRNDGMMKSSLGRQLDHKNLQCYYLLSNERTFFIIS